MHLGLGDGAGRIRLHAEGFDERDRCFGHGDDVSLLDLDGIGPDALLAVDEGRVVCGGVPIGDSVALDIHISMDTRAVRHADGDIVVIGRADRVQTGPQDGALRAFLALDVP